MAILSGVNLSHRPGMIERPDYKRTKWNGWGAPGKAFDLYERPGLAPFLSQKLGLYHFHPARGLALHEITLRPTRMTDGARKDLAAIVGEENLNQDTEARASHAVGKSYEDLVNARRGELEPLPDAVVYPSAERDVRDLLAWASDNHVAVIPFGGGTGVAGGVAPLCGPGQELAVVADLRNLDKILFVDAQSQTAKAEPGIRGPVLEECLRAQGLTLGHFPDSFEYSTVGGWVATRCIGQYFGCYGRIEDLVVGVNLETPVGALEIGGVPARAAGPELRDVVVGSEGSLGIITLVEMRLHRRPEARQILAYLLPSFEEGMRAARELVQAGFRLGMTRLSDAEETEMLLALQPRASGPAEYLRRGVGRLVLQGRGLQRPSLLLVGLDGKSRHVERDAREISAYLEEHRGYDLGEGPGRDFERDRFMSPYLRDALMDIGILVETFETAAPWAGLHRLYGNLRKTVGHVCEERGVRFFLGGRVSHAYTSGASLCLTLLAPVGAGEELKLWRACKLAAVETIIRGGGTLSHQHGIGSVHREWMMQEHGPIGVAVLRALKETLDPEGILNPGKLLP